MKLKCVCSDCGHDLIIEKTDDGFNPDRCDGCGGLITAIGHTATSTDEVAWVEGE